MTPVQRLGRALLRRDGQRLVSGHHRLDAPHEGLCGLQDQLLLVIVNVAVENTERFGFNFGRFYFGQKILELMSFWHKFLHSVTMLCIGLTKK